MEVAAGTSSPLGMGFASAGAQPVSLYSTLPPSATTQAQQASLPSAGGGEPPISGGSPPAEAHQRRLPPLTASRPPVYAGPSSLPPASSGLAGLSSSRAGAVANSQVSAAPQREPSRVVYEDEMWENEALSRSGVWAPSLERARFSDRLGRFKFASLQDVPLAIDAMYEGPGQGPWGAAHITVHHGAAAGVVGSGAPARLLGSKGSGGASGSVNSLAMEVSAGNASAANESNFVYPSSSHAATPAAAAAERPHWVVVQDWSCEGSKWRYGKNFQTLENDLAKGVARTDPQKLTTANSNVRWRRWVRTRSSTSSTVDADTVLCGWLGSRIRRGVWKSRYYILLSPSSARAGAVGGPGALNSSSSLFGSPGAASPFDLSPMLGPEQPSDSSEDDGGGGDLASDDDEPSIASPTMSASMMRSLSTESFLSPPSSSSAHQTSDHSHTTPPLDPILAYLRRGFDSDPRSCFAQGIQSSELRRMSKKQVRIQKLSTKCRVEPTGTSERFLLKFPGSALNQRTLCATTREERVRWVDTLRALLDYESSRRGAMSQIKKSGGRALLTAFRNATTRTSSLGGGAPSGPGAAHPSGAARGGAWRRSLPPPSSASLFPGAPTAARSPVHKPNECASLASATTTTVELLRNPTTAMMHVRLSETAAGLHIDVVGEEARACPVPSGPALPASTWLEPGQKVVRLGSDSDFLSTAMVGTRLVRAREYFARQAAANQSVFLTVTAAPASPPPGPGRSLAETSGGDKGISSSSEDNNFIGSATCAQQQQQPCLKQSLSDNSSLGSPIVNKSKTQSVSLRRVPENDFGITTSIAMEACRHAILESFPEDTNPTEVTYASILKRAAGCLGANESLFEDPAWTAWFRDQLDELFSSEFVEEYVVGGLDFASMTPFVERRDSTVQECSKTSSYEDDEEDDDGEREASEGDAETS